MNKKGFTLVEVLGVIVLISLIFLISYTTMLNTLKKSHNKIDENILDLLSVASRDYITDNQDQYPEVNNNVFCIDINTLIDNNYIDEDIIISQDNQILSKYVKVIYKNNKYNCEISSECSNIIVND